MTKILFGTAGVPHSSKAGDSISGMERIKELGLDAMELEFVRGVNISEEGAKKIAEANKKLGIELSVHAPYYVNLNSLDEKKLKASKERIWQSALMGELAGAKIVTFHPAYFQGMDPAKVMDRVEEGLKELTEKLKKTEWKIKLAPETTGKNSVFGSLEETLKLCERIKELKPMIDFAHLHARGNGLFKKKEDFLKEIKKIPSKYLKDLRMHVSGINYSEKGERNHLNFDDSDFKYRFLLEALKDCKVSGIIICESPNLEEDALKMKEYYEKL